MSVYYDNNRCTINYTDGKNIDPISIKHIQANANHQR